MIYQSDHLTLRSVMDVFQGEINDVMICEEISGGGGVYYTLLTVKDHDAVKKLLRIMKQSERGEDCCVDIFSSNGRFCMVFPYIKERKLSDFYMAKAFPLSLCQEICLNLLLQCMSSPLPYPLLELVLKQGQIHLLKDNSIALGYCIDLADLHENSGQKECVMQCAIRIRELLQEKTTKKNVSYQLLLKKIPKQSYQDFRELYKDIRLSAANLGKRGLKKRVKEFWARNQETVFKFLLYLSVVLAAAVLLMFLSNVIWGEIPFLRLFFNSFEQIGTESLIK
ncbi:MAG: hypothetical protein J6C33_03740 [Lachnospiraceae bacterium]|nr:hypothetical protein [Lachnospiraceae bacterium]